VACREHTECESIWVTGMMHTVVDCTVPGSYDPSVWRRTGREETLELLTIYLKNN